MTTQLTELLQQQQSKVARLMVQIKLINKVTRENQGHKSNYYLGEYLNQQKFPQMTQN